MEKLEKKYGFWTTSAMVVGIVIGSGVFFKADDVLIASGGSLPIALLAWFIGGAIMVVTAYVFSKIASKIERVNGIVDYFEEAYGNRAAFNIAWFMTTIYYPSLVSVLSWVSANYTCALTGNPDQVWFLAFFYLVLFFLVNLASPIIAGRLQVSTTIIKLVPLLAVGIIGTIVGLVNGQTVSSFANTAQNITGKQGGLALASLSTAFAYEGWIIATTINAEIKDAKKTLPRALVFGTILIVVVYMLYYVGIASVMPNSDVISNGDNTSLVVITTLFGPLSGTLLTVFVIVSCLGTLNGLVMASSRGMYSIAVRNMGLKPEIFSRVNSRTNSTLYSGISGFVFSFIWLVVWYGNFNNWFSGFLDISELPIAFLYFVYLSLYFWFMKNFKDANTIDRFVTPILATAGSLYIIWAAIHKEMFITFSVIIIIIMLTGNILNRKNP